MLIVGSDDGVYRVTGLDEPDPDVTRGSETGRVRRGRDFEGLAGVFVATETGLYHPDERDTWTNSTFPGRTCTPSVQVRRRQALCGDPTRKRVRHPPGRRGSGQLWCLPCQAVGRVNFGVNYGRRRTL